MGAAHSVSFTRLILTSIQLGLYFTGYTRAVSTMYHMPMARDGESSASPSTSFPAPSPDACQNFQVTIILATNLYRYGDWDPVTSNSEVKFKELVILTLIWERY